MQIDKNQLVRFLQQRKRGIYTQLVKCYADTINSMSMNLALEVIKEDLEKSTSLKVDINYFSLAQAITRYKKKAGTTSLQVPKKWEFKDAHEIKDDQSVPGRFTLKR